MKKLILSFVALVSIVGTNVDAAQAPATAQEHAAAKKRIYKWLGTAKEHAAAKKNVDKWLGVEEVSFSARHAKAIKVAACLTLVVGIPAAKLAFWAFNNPDKAAKLCDLIQNYGVDCLTRACKAAVNVTAPVVQESLVNATAPIIQAAVNATETAIPEVVSSAANVTAPVVQESLVNATAQVIQEIANATATATPTQAAEIVKEAAKRGWFNLGVTAKLAGATAALCFIAQQISQHFATPEAALTSAARLTAAITGVGQ